MICDVINFVFSSSNLAMGVGSNGIDPWYRTQDPVTGKRNHTYKLHGSCKNHLRYQIHISCLLELFQQWILITMHRYIFTFRFRW